MESGQTPRASSQPDPAPQTISTREQIDQLNVQAWQLRITEPERALTLSSAALLASQALAQPYERGVALSLITLSFLDGESGMLESALTRALEALACIQGQPQPEVMIGAWYSLGWAYYYAGNYPAALEFGFKSLKLAREAGLLEWTAWCLDLTASTYKDPAEALSMYEEAHEIFIRSGNLIGQSRILNNWAYTLMETHNLPAALEMAQRSLVLAQQAGLKRDEINLAATIGEILAKLGEYEQARSGLQQAAQLFDTYGRDISSVYVLAELGQVYLGQNNLGLAEHELTKALTVAQGMDMRNEQARCHKSLSEIHEKRGEFQQALEHFKAYQILQEAIAGEGALKQLSALRVSQQIETAQRDAEIQRLQKEKLQLELDEHKRMHALLEDLATRDPLTNLFNRRHFIKLAEQEWKRAVRYKHPLCALMLDVDDFKQINDQYGHAVGDQALTAMANIIQSSLRSTEIAGRYGGDEFVVLLPETLPQHGVLVGQRICRTLKELQIETGRGRVFLSPSLGVACMQKGDSQTIHSLDELLSHADHALYIAKHMGKGQVRLYSE